MKRLSALLFVLGSSLAVFSPTLADAQEPIAVGNEFQVNVYTTGNQLQPSVAVDESGNFLVVWRDTSRIQGALFHSDGSPFGDEFQVNEFLASAASASAARIPSGFVVAWIEYSNFNEMYGRLLHSDGSPIGSQFQISDDVVSGNNISVAPSGEFIVVWQTDTGNDIRARRYASDGSSSGDEFLVNSYTTGMQTFPAIATLNEDGEFVVAWTTLEAENGGPSSGSIQGRRFTSDGSFLGPQFLISESTTGSQTATSVAADGSGGFAVVWTDSGIPGEDSLGIQGRRFTSDGVPLGSQFQVNTYTTNAQLGPQISLRPSGEFTVVWQSIEGDGSSSTIQGRSFDFSGAPISSQFQVNTYTTGTQNSPATAVDATGDMIIGWASDGSAGTDDSFLSVQARRYRVTGDVGDRVWRDENLDGVQDAGESGSADVAIDLLDDQSQVVASTVTDAEGAYLFEKVAPGDYFIQVDPPPGWLFSPRDSGFDDALDSDVDETGESDFFTVESAVVLRDVDAGGLVLFGVGDRVWRDLDGGGVQDGGEPGAAGVTVTLFDAADTQIAQTQTDADGAYSFEAPPGDYYLEFTAPAGNAFTLRDVGSDELDSDVNANGVTSVFTIDGVEDSFDAGLVSTTATIGNRVWLDDGDGLKSGGEPGLENVTVNLYDLSSTVLDTVQTDSLGFYEFTAEPGEYYLEFELPADHAFAPRDQGTDDAIDSDVFAATGTTAKFLVVAGIDDPTRDAGIEPATIGNRVWIDANGDGRQQPGEAGLSGVIVRLLDDDETEIAVTATDADGVYGFLGVASGDYFVEVLAPLGTAFTAQDRGDDDLIDSDVDPTTGRTALFIYEAGGASRSHDAGLTVFFEVIFSDGFESGDLSTWSSTVP